jgi:hypothetical protein
MPKATLNSAFSQKKIPKKKFQIFFLKFQKLLCLYSYACNRGSACENFANEKSG